MADSQDKPVGTPTPDGRPRAAEDLAAQLEGSSIEEVLRIQDHLAKFVRDRYEKQVAVLFSDIAGSTAYFEKHGDAAGRRMIQRHNDLLMPLIEARAGKIVKTIGDAIMATFPSAHPAVDAAIAMQQAVHEANNRATSDAERFEIRIGVNYGTALVNDKDGDVYGDMVNVAARVQAQAEKRQILISEGVRECVSPTVPIRTAGKFSPKGKSQEFALFEVVWREVAKQEVPLDRPKIDPRYVVLEMLGSGGMASVWRARDERLGRDVAVKSLHRHVQLSASARERFQREARVAASLTHENITQVYDYSAQGASEAFIAMELVEGPTLRAYLEKAGPQPSAAVALIGHEIARGLGYAHLKGVVHRDVKPENILISKAGAVKISDFGIAGVGELARLTATGAAIGTPAYLSPEQVKGSGADPRSDQFSLGVILYEIATGRSPFAGESSTAVMYRIVEGNYTPPEAAGRVEPDLAAVIKKCLARDPRDRFSSAEALADRLRKVLSARGIADPRSALARFFAGEPLPDPRPGALRRRRLSARRVLILSLAVVAVTGMGAVGARVAFRQELPPPGLPKTPSTPTGPPLLVLAPADEPAPRASPAAVAGVDEPALKPSPDGVAGVDDPAPRPSPAGAAGLDDLAPRPSPSAAAVRGEAAPRKPPVRSAVVGQPASKAPAAPAAERPRGKPLAIPQPPPTSEPPPREEPRPEASRDSVNAAQFGSLKLVVSGGWADIKVDGVKKGQAPVLRLLILPAGAHVLELAGNPLRRPYRAQIQIEPGKTIEHHALLQALP